MLNVAYTEKRIHEIVYVRKNNGKKIARIQDETAPLECETEGKIKWPALMTHDDDHYPAAHSSDDHAGTSERRFHARLGQTEGNSSLEREKNDEENA